VEFADVEGYADLDEVIARALGAWRPPPLLSLSQWADRNFVLSAETAAEPGHWHTLPYQREPMDAISDPRVTQVTLKKSARIGYTLMMSTAMGYFIDQDPCSVMVVQPTVDDAKNFSKETVAPMLRDVPVLRKIFGVEEKSKGPKDSSATLTLKTFPGGLLDLIGANSGSGFRRKSRRVVMFDEVDAYPPSAGSDGDQIELGMKRAEAFHNRKIIAGSTPLLEGASRIEELFLEGDQRRYYVPCPHCGHMDFLVFREGPRGHYMWWPDEDPKKAVFICKSCGCHIEHKHKRWMVEHGEWRADKPGGDHRSYHIWSAYSYSPNATWGQIAARFLKATRGGSEKLKTFVNTELGETWKERGEAPAWERLHQRREPYAIGTVPDGAIVLTTGVDVQQNRFVYEVVGWAPNKENWSVEAGELHGDTALASTWDQLDELLARTYRSAGDGAPEMPIAMMAVDSGFRAQMAYAWGRNHPMSRVIAIKGMSGAQRPLIGASASVDMKLNGKVYQKGYRIWPVGGEVGKSELYGWLGLKLAEDGTPPSGYCHFPEGYTEEFFKQLTAEHLVKIVSRRTGRTRFEWQQLPNRENHHLDARIYARAAVALLGLDRMVTTHRSPRSPVPAPSPGAAAREVAAPLPPRDAPRQPRADDGRPRSSFWGRPRDGTGPSSARPSGGWFGRRR
jgi:phage terminase large subunit GpA-like protein